MLKFFSFHRKTLTSEQRKLHKRLEEMLGFKPKNIKIYAKAFQHKSQFEKIEENNERLEYLGDAILDAVISDCLYHRYPKKREGFLTKMRSKMVSRKTLNEIGLAMGIDELILSQIQQETHQTSLCGNAFEALIGAIYLDQGYTFTTHFIQEQILNKYISFKEFESLELDYKSKLIEWSQKNKVKVSFETEEITQEPNDARFVGKVVANGHTLGTGKGPSKKKAEQNASKAAYERNVKNTGIAT